MTSPDMAENANVASGSVSTVVRDYLQLIKLRMGMLSAFLAVAGYYIALWDPINWMTFIHVFLGTLVVCIGAFALNMHMERDVDALMDRTKNRPIPSGRIATGHALGLGIIASILGIAYFALTTNWLCAAAAAVGTLGYALVYTPLKRTTQYNTLVGGIPGAMPPVIGWLAARGQFEFGTFQLFSILYLWQLPHFLALAWMYKDDYARAGLAMITTMDPTGSFTARQMVWYTVVFVLATFAPYYTDMAGNWYLAAAIITGLIFLYLVLDWARKRDRDRAGVVKVFLFSLVNLPVLFLMLVMDKVF